jgi:chromosome segregation ATPase
MPDEFEFTLPEPVARPRPPLLLPWMVATLAIVALVVVAVYAKKLLDEQSARTFQATRMADEYGARASKLEADQKDARRQAMAASEKTDELRASTATLADQVKDKDAALAHLQERHEKLVTDLRTAVRTSKGKALPKRVESLLARDSAAGASSERGTPTRVSGATRLSRSRARH